MRDYGREFDGLVQILHGVNISIVQHFIIWRSELTFGVNRESITIPKDPRTLCPVGHAFVSLSTPASAERAIADLTGRMLLGRKVSIELAHFKNLSDAAVPMTAASRESAIDELIREESEKVHIAVSNGVVSKNVSLRILRWVS